MEGTTSQYEKDKLKERTFLGTAGANGQERLQFVNAHKIHEYVCPAV